MFGCFSFCPRRLSIQDVDQCCLASSCTTYGFVLAFSGCWVYISISISYLNTYLFINIINCLIPIMLCMAHLYNITTLTQITYKKM